MKKLPEIINTVKPWIIHYIQNNMFYSVRDILSDSVKALSKSGSDLNKFSNRYTEHECVIFKNKISCGSGEIALATSLVFYRNLYGELPSKVLIIKPVKMSSIKIIFEVYEARFENYKFVDKKKLCDVHVVRVRIPILKNADNIEAIVEKIKSIHPRTYLTHLITSNKHSDYVNVFFLTKRLNIDNVGEDVKKLLAQSNLSKFIQKVDVSNHEKLL